MEQLAEACRAYAATAPAHTHHWTEHATVIAILAFAVIGWFWTLNKALNFGAPRIYRAYERTRERYLSWRYPEPSQAWLDANDAETIRRNADNW